MVPPEVEIRPATDGEPTASPSDPALAALDSGSGVAGTEVSGAAAAAVTIPTHSYPGSKPPEADGSAPSGGYTIKAVEASKKFHDPGSPVYRAVVADVYFRDPEDAAVAGFRYWGNRKKALPRPAVAAPDVAVGTPDVPAAAGGLPPGAVAPNADGSAPAGYPIKAVMGSRRFHGPGSPVYSVLVADVYFREPEDAAAAGFASWKSGKIAGPAPAAEAPASAAPEAVGPPPGSALPTADGSAPAGYPIKGNAGSKRYHDPDSPFYSATRADMWFRDADAAAAAGFVSWKAPR